MIPVERGFASPRATAENDEFEGMLAREQRRIRLVDAGPGVQVEIWIKRFLEFFRPGGIKEEFLGRFEGHSDVCRESSDSLAQIIYHIQVCLGTHRSTCE